MPVKFSRRGFLGLLATGAVGACVAAKIPTALLPQPVRTRAACEFLRKAYNDACERARIEGWPTNGEWRWHPHEMYAGRELYEAFEGELIANERFVMANTDDRGESLMFKGARLFPEGRGWTVRIAR
jgi:hypothetical protein